MTEQVEELTRGEALARVAVLEAENADLRKRVCVPDASTMARVLSDRAASACCVDPDDNWKIYGQEFIEDVRAMLAAPAPVEQEGQEPAAWIRFRSDGCYEGPHRSIDDVRKRSGKWTPLYPAPAPVERVEQSVASFRYSYPDALRLCEQGLAEWRDKAHNKRWWKKLDGTPIPNDLLSCIASVFSNANRTAPQTAAPAPDVAGLLNRIIPRIDAGGLNPINPEAHCCEWTLHRERERIHAEFADALAAHQSGGAK